jgi:alkanesulfonate monooxygenase SsuD/methylene tetrahydromethanopterin reductase-like flavin-dependent oxidoreductase (luciferase family)
VLHLQDLSGGRSVLGLGTLVRGHIERRFSAELDSPGPRFREYADSLAIIFQAWRSGEPPSYTAKFYSFSLMTPESSPGPGSSPIRRSMPGTGRSAMRRRRPASAHDRSARAGRGDAGRATRTGEGRRPKTGFEVVGGGFIAAD